MDVRIQELPFEPTALRGLSDKLLLSHHQNNYGGAVKRLNAIRAQLMALDFTKAPGFQVNGLKREELIAANSMVLHELYFGSLGSDGQTVAPAMTRRSKRTSAASSAGALSSCRWAGHRAVARAGSC